MSEIPKWTYKELEEIDKQHTKAKEIEQEAQDFKNKNYDLCVRRSQEAFELFLKIVFKLLKEKYPPKHELSKQIISIHEKLKPVFKDYFPKDIAKLMIGSKVLDLWRNISLYGEEKLENVGTFEIFTEKEAELALDYMSKASQLCYLVRDYFYKNASKHTV